MIDGRNFFYQPVNNKERTYSNIWKIANGQGDDYTTGSVLDYRCGKDHYTSTTIDLSKYQSVLDADPKAMTQINFTGKLKENTTIFFILEEVKQTGFYFLQATITHFWVYFALI